MNRPSMISPGCFTTSCKQSTDCSVLTRKLHKGRYISISLLNQTPLQLKAIGTDSDPKGANQANVMGVAEISTEFFLCINE